MSLVRAGRGERRIAGALLMALLAGGVLGVLLASGHSFGAGLRFTVELASTGALRPNARIKLAGRDVGEVRSMVRGDDRAGAPGLVRLSCYVARPWDREVRVNSDLFVATPSILGEAWLEIAPPRAGEPGPPLAEGATVRGADPPNLDELIGRLYRATRDVLSLLGEHRPELDRLVFAWARLSATLAGLGVDGAWIARQRARTNTALAEGRAVAAAARDQRLTQREQAMARDLDLTGAALRPRLAELSRSVAIATRGINALVALLPPAEREQAGRSIAQLRHAAEVGQSLVTTLDDLRALVDRGEGTVGGLLADKELFDDLHESQRILKHQPWTLFIKPPKGKKTIAR